MTNTTPIVMAPASDPLGTGIVNSLARPGGNITGVSLLWNPANPANSPELRRVEATARALFTWLPVISRGAEFLAMGHPRAETSRVQGVFEQ